MILITEIKKEDLEGLSLLYEELSERKTNYEKMEKNFNWMKGNPDYIVLGAKYNGTLVGTLMCIICRDMVGECKPFMVIENVVAISTMRGKGVGRALIERIEEIGRELDCNYIMFVSAMKRKGSHDFYQSLGYELDMVQGFKKYL